MPALTRRHWNQLRSRRLRRRLAGAGSPRPAHIGLVMDGNRRWARAAGHLDPSVGHRYGAEHVEDVLGWCEDWDIEHLTVYVLSADNIRKRGSAEINYLMSLSETVIPAKVLSAERQWRLHVSGDLSLLPASTAAALTNAQQQTSSRPRNLTLAVGYDGRADIVSGIRNCLVSSGAANFATLATQVDVAAITGALPGGPVKEIDLVIRTSGEHRLSGFFPWQSAHAEFFVSPKMWPSFDELDFARALQWYADRRSGQ